MAYRYLLFDLGRVLVELRPSSFLKRFKPGWSESQIDRWWSKLVCIHQFETGQIDEAVFLEKAAQETGFGGTVTAFRQLFIDWILGVYPGAEDLIYGLRDHMRVGILSNTNALHISLIRRDTRLLQAFHDRFFSYELGMLKPDRRVYEHVLDHIGMPADKVVFFDDSPANIEAAAALGIHSVLVSGFEDLVCKLDRLMPDKNLKQQRNHHRAAVEYHPDDTI